MNVLKKNARKQNGLSIRSEYQRRWSRKKVTYRRAISNLQKCPNGFLKLRWVTKVTEEKTLVTITIDNQNNICHSIDLCGLNESCLRHIHSLLDEYKLEALQCILDLEQQEEEDGETEIDKMLKDDD